jgi:hypothetical protein
VSDSTLLTEKIPGQTLINNGGEKETTMNPFMDAHAHSTIARVSEAPMLTEHKLLAHWGFTDEEIVSLLWLQQWYQMEGSDREFIVRHLEFLRLLVRTGELEE